MRMCHKSVHADPWTRYLRSFSSASTVLARGSHHAVCNNVLVCHASTFQNDSVRACSKLVDVVEIDAQQFTHLQIGIKPSPCKMCICTYTPASCVHSDYCRHLCSAWKSVLCYVCMRACIHMSMCMCSYMNVCMCVCMYVCMYVCLYVCTSVRLYVCMHVCMYVCMRARSSASFRNMVMETFFFRNMSQLFRRCLGPFSEMVPRHRGEGVLLHFQA